MFATVLVSDIFNSKLNMTENISRSDGKSRVDLAVSQRIRSAIAHLDLSNSEMARKLGLDAGEWEQMLAGRKRVPAAMLVQISEMTGVPLASFFTGDFVAKH